MDRVQRSGLIALLVLLTIAGGGWLVGSGSTDADDVVKPVGFDPSGSTGVTFLPPSQRKLVLTKESFQRPPAAHPLRTVANSSASPVLIPAPVAANARVANRVAKARVIVVREGDNLQTIAQREMGSFKHWKAIADFNGISDPRRLAIGQSLTLPTPGVAVPVSASLEETQPVKTPGRLPAEYVVQAGDVAGIISQKLYGTSKKWNALLRHNGIDDPLELRPGQVLQVPDLR